MTGFDKKSQSEHGSNHWIWRIRFKRFYCQHFLMKPLSTINSKKNWLVVSSDKLKSSLTTENKIRARIRLEKSLGIKPFLPWHWKCNFLLELCWERLKK